MNQPYFNILKAVLKQSYSIK